MTRDPIVRAIFKALEQLDGEMELGLAISENTVIVGDDSALDSMAFLNLIGMLEEWIADEHGLFVGIISEEEEFAENSPFGKVKDLADYLEKLISRELAGLPENV